MSKKLAQLQKGTTLIELMVYMALLSIFLLILSQLFAAILDVSLEAETTSSVEQDGRFILSRLNYDILRAGQITQPANLGGSSSVLSLVINGTAYTYSLNSGNLQLTDNLGADNLNSSETTISSINFQKIGNSGGKETVKIQFTIQSVTQRAKGVEVKTFQETIGRR